MSCQHSWGVSNEQVGDHASDSVCVHSGLFVGKEGPMIHSGAIVGAGLPQVHILDVT